MMIPDKEGETTWYNSPSEVCVGVFKDLSQTNKQTKKFEAVLTTCNNPEIVFYQKIRSRKSEKAVLSSTVAY